jgi:hypothetical protein
MPRRIRRLRPPSAAEEAERIDRSLAGFAARVRSGAPLECAWELFRLQYFPGWKPARVAAAVAAWSQREAISVAFEIRKVHSVDIIFMVFTCSG